MEEKLGLTGARTEPPKPSTGGPKAGSGEGEGWWLLLRQCAARTCLVGAAFTFALYAPYDNLIGLAGGLCAVPLAFIFPGWFHLRLCSELKGWGRALDFTLIAFGTVMAPVAIVAAIVSWH